MMYDREKADSDWTAFDSFLLSCFILLGVGVGMSIVVVVWL